jgi:hypothetical protein
VGASAECVARVERSETLDSPLRSPCRPRISLALNPGYFSRLEAGEVLQPRTVEAIQNALEKAGIEFINGDTPSVRLERRRWY